MIFFFKAKDILVLLIMEILPIYSNEICDDALIMCLSLPLARRITKATFTTGLCVELHARRAG